MLRILARAAPVRWRAVRRLVVLLALILAAPAAAATIQGTLRGELLLGTPLPDRMHASGGDDFVQAAFGGVDQVDCGAGNDLVSADLGDRVAHCETVVRRLSVDPYREPGQPARDRGRAGQLRLRLDDRDRVPARTPRGGAAANIGTAVSRDAGRTWQRSILPGLTTQSVPPGPESSASDPTVAYDAVHAVWLVGTLTLESAGSSHVYVARSTDGAHWSTPVDVASGPMLDKDWFVCDNGAASPFRGRCYAEYTDDQLNETVSQFTNDGGVTWSAPAKATSTLVGTQPVVRPDGTLVVVAGDYNGEAGLTGSIVAVRSTDGGATFTRTTVSSLQAHDNDPMRAIALPVGRHRLRRDDLCVVARLPLPRRLRRERHRPLDLLRRRPDVDRARARADRTGVLGRRRRSFRASPRTLRGPATSRSSTRTTRRPPAAPVPARSGSASRRLRMAASPGRCRGVCTRSRS